MNKYKQLKQDLWEHGSVWYSGLVINLFSGDAVEIEVIYPNGDVIECACFGELEYTLEEYERVNNATANSSD